MSEPEPQISFRLTIPLWRELIKDNFDIIELELKKQAVNILLKELKDSKLLANIRRIAAEENVKLRTAIQKQLINSSPFYAHNTFRNMVKLSPEGHKLMKEAAAKKVEEAIDNELHGSSDLLLERISKLETELALVKRKLNERTRTRK